MKEPIEKRYLCRLYELLPMVCIASLCTVFLINVPANAKQVAKVAKSKAKSRIEARKNSKKSSQNTKSKNEMVAAWHLSQSSNLIGPLKMIVSSCGVRLKAEKMGLLWIFSAPDWDAYLYNVETKNYCTFKYDVWKERGFFMTSTPKQRALNKKSLQALTVKKTGKVQKIANLKVEQVFFLQVSGAKYGEFWITSKVTVPNQFKELIANMLRLPPHSGGTPLKAFLLSRHTGELAPVLNTESAVQKPVNVSLFKPLKGYKRVKDEVALLFSDSDIFGTGNTAGDKKENQK